MSLGRASRVVVVAAFWAALAGAACAPAPVPSRPLRILVAADLPSLDPQSAWDEVSSAVLGNLFDCLVRFDAALRVRPGVARSWTNPDDTTWRFHIDPAARFHDGAPVRASDVVFSIQRQQSLQGSGGQVFARQVRDVRAVDDATVDVLTDAPATLLSSLAYVPILSRRHTSAAPAGALPVGSGPYRLVAWEPGRRLTLQASPHWPVALPVRDVEFLLRPPDMRVEQVAEVRPDLTLFLRLASARQLERQPIPGLRVRRASGLAVYYLALNVRPRGRQGAPNPLADPRVREALALALDREAIVRRGLDGYGHAVAQLVPHDVTGFDPSQALPARDVARARELLRAAGRGDLRLRLLRARSEPHWLAHLLAEQWAQAGVQLEHEALDDEQVERALASGDFDVTVQGYSCSSGDAAELLSFLLRSPGSGGGAGNVAGYANPEVDALADANPRLFDPRDRLAAVQRALRLASADRPYVPLYTVDDLYVVSPALRFTPALNGEVRVADMALAPE